jgi:hypothetical protein
VRQLEQVAGGVSGFGDGLDFERTQLDDESREYVFVTRRT